MGIDYVLDVSCTPKQDLGGVEGLVNLLKARSRADLILGMCRDNGDARSPAEVELEMVLQTPDGDQTRRISVQELLDEAASLEPARGHCGGCPANRDSPGFGCYRSIPYPIPEAAEAWLLSLLPDDLDSTAGQLLVRAVEDFGWDGEHAAEMRADDDLFFESRDPLAVRWGDGDGALEIDSNQLFHMLFHVGPIGSTHALLCCLFFGVIPHDIELDALDDRLPLLATAAVPQPPDEACEPLAGFLHTLAIAARLDVDVLVDG
jgi:hypothetical protein